ncbi:hypothetical protein [Roseateles saccharophilus]|uniref:Uncharacterized protein n=1 Tax=Roseateles saccharophilus TaxID=304 RepID=A0A4R3UJJ1_ROSSA|nr:hypothetical protein [Roseateles saccharophilus]MDG0834816.1 hypothetical protein [Roseateles saccharophilus]TCU88939.1 hypothetical protein EV671_103721 [Roseateles saccharophilus]
MQLDLNSVDSIVAWWQVFPERHDSYLDYKLRASPEFSRSINAARRRIAASPELRALRRRSIEQRRSSKTWDTEQDGAVSAPESRFSEFAMG